LGTKSISLFAMYTIIGTNTVSNPWHRYQCLSLYLFEGKSKASHDTHAFKNRLFLAKLGAKTTSHFAIYTM
jgi:hypothetical protein